MKVKRRERLPFTQIRFQIPQAINTHYLYSFLTTRVTSYLYTFTETTDSFLNSDMSGDDKTEP